MLYIFTLYCISSYSILIDGAIVEQVYSFKLLGVHIKTVVKRARQSLFPLRKLKRFGSCNIQSMVASLVASLPGTATARLLIARH